MSPVKALAIKFLILISPLAMGLLIIEIVHEPEYSERYKLTYAPIEDSDQPVHPHSVIRAFNGRSMGSRGYNVSSLS